MSLTSEYPSRANIRIRSISSNLIGTKRPVKRLSNDSTSGSTVETAASSRIGGCVCFDMQVMVRTIPRHDDFTADEKEELWYNRYEKQAMIEGALKGAADMSPRDQGARGLEQFTCEGSYSRRENRLRAAAYILREQARQQRLFTKNGDDLLAKAAAHISGPCQEKANEIAREDEAEAYPQWHVKLPPPTADEYPQRRPRLSRFLGWLQEGRERWASQQQ